MSILRKTADIATTGMSAIVRALTAGLDALIGPVARMNERTEAHLRDRTTLLRAHYGKKSNREAKPLPVVEAPIDLALRDGVREVA